MSIYADDNAVRDLTIKVMDSGAHVFQIFQHGDEFDHIVYLLEKFNPPPGRVLDVGCGVGAVARGMTMIRQDLKFTLLNISASQLELCGSFYPHENIEKMLADACDIPLPDACMDSVIACYVLGHLDKDKALAEMRRVLRPGGVLFIVDITGGPIDELDYVAHDFGGEVVEGMNTRSFDKLMPWFSERYPNIRPAIMREVKA